MYNLQRVPNILLNEGDYHPLAINCDNSFEALGDNLRRQAKAWPIEKQQPRPRHEGSAVGEHLRAWK